MALVTMVLGDINLTASTIIWWLVVGLIAGVLASFVMRGGYGIVGDIVIGIVGAFLGGFLASLLGIGASGFVATLIIAFIGACILIAILRMISRSYPGSRRRL
jgi:uncharacterized membrane protein YeaQ/YmgE (transglycosylase-associated protein family)